jgi:hypothetical protein
MRRSAYSFSLTTPVGRQKLIKLEAEIELERAQDSAIYKYIHTMIMSASRAT